MKITCGKVFLILFLFSSSSLASLIDDQSNFESDVEVGVIMNMISQPTSMRGAAVFEIPQLKANFELTQAEGNSFQFIVRGTDTRDATSKKFQMEAEKAAILLKSYFPTSFWLEAGLIANPWNEVSEELWDFQFWGPSSFPALRRYKYLSVAELGVNAHWNWSERWGTTLSVMNGESAVENEKGSRKDVQAIVWYEDETWQSSFGYLRGAYDDDEPEINEKERQLFRLAYVWEPVQVSLELYRAKDSSRAINALFMAESLDLSSYLNQSIKGEGGSLTLRWNYDNNYALRLRADQLNPATQLADMTLSSQIVAVSYEPTQFTHFALIYLRTSHGLSHSSAPKYDEKGIVAVGMHF